MKRDMSRFVVRLGLVGRTCCREMGTLGGSYAGLSRAGLLPACQAGRRVRVTVHAWACLVGQASSGTQQVGLDKNPCFLAVCRALLWTSIVYSEIYDIVDRVVHLFL